MMLMVPETSRFSPFLGGYCVLELHYNRVVQPEEEKALGSP